MNKGFSFKKVWIGLAGGLVVAAGVAMIVLPGPAFIVIPAGLAILATQFEWARRALDAIRERIHRLRSKRKRST